MCVTEITTDIYPNNAYFQQERLLLCDYGHSDRPCGHHYRRELRPRLLTFHEAPAAIMGSQPHHPPPPPPPLQPLHHRPIEVEVVEAEHPPRARPIKKRVYWPKAVEFIFEVRVPEDKNKKRHSRESEGGPFIVEPPRSPYPIPPPPPPPAPMPPLPGGFGYCSPPPPPPPPPGFPQRRSSFQIPVRNRAPPPPPIITDHRFGRISPPSLSPFRQHSRASATPPPMRREGDAILARQVEAERRLRTEQANRADLERERAEMARERERTRRREREEERARRREQEERNRVRQREEELNRIAERTRRREREERNRIAADRERDRQRAIDRRLAQEREREAVRQALLRGEATHRRRPVIHQERGTSSGDEGWVSSPGAGVRIVNGPRLRQRPPETMAERGERILGQAIGEGRRQGSQERRQADEQRANGGLRRRGTIGGGEWIYNDRRRRSSFHE